MKKRLLITFSTAALCAATALLMQSLVGAQIAPAPPTVPAPDVPQPAPTPEGSPASLPTSYPHHYLEQNIALTETDKTFYAPRRQLGCSFPSGVTDSTITTSVRFAVDQAILAKFLATIKPRVDSKPVPAHPVLTAPIVHETALKSDNTLRAAKIVPAEPGVTLLIPDSASAIANTIVETPLATTIPLTVDTGALPETLHSLVGIDSRLAHFVTHFNPGEVGRTVTVRRAIQLVDGTVLQPGDIFSINQTVGVRTIARGFGIGKVFINGTMEDQVGGGMCQVATTLFNAALLANLKIIERHQHVRTVPYVPAGGDATVYYGEKDFEFQNDTDAPVYIYYKTYGSFAVADIYGKGDPTTKIRVETIPTKIGERYYKGVIRRYVTVAGKTTSNFTAYSTYKWTPSLDYLR